MKRRGFLATSLAAWGTAGPRARGFPAPGEEVPFVRCDADRLVRVLVHRPGPETHKVLALGDTDDPMMAADLFEDHADDQHRTFCDLLRASGAEVLEFVDLLDGAIAEARAAGQFARWLARVEPRLAPHEPRVTAAALVGADDDFIYASDDRDGIIRPLTTPLKFLLFVRDLAVMTPKGVVLANFVNRTRAFENDLTGLLFRWSPALNRYPVAFDAQAEGVYLQGGDLIVADARTLLLGVNNLTQEKAAPRLARALDMDVVAVELLGEGIPAGGRLANDVWTGLRVKFLHLDSVINLVAPGVALATPYFLESAYAGDDPLTSVLLGLVDRPAIPRAYLEHTTRALARIGLVRLYRAGSGEPDPSVRGLKLVDFLRGRGYRVLPVCGPPPTTGAAKHVVECVHRELRFQAANVLATAPGRLILPGSNRRTEAALRAAGVEVATFAADAIVRWHGGPHCLSLPLERADDAG